MLIAAGSRQRLGSDAPILTVAEPARPDGAWSGGRTLFMDGKPGFELSWPCGTCQFLFRRVAADTYSIDSLSARLAEGLDDLDPEVIETFGYLLPEGEYVPRLSEIEPQLVVPGSPSDYFAHEQVETWGLESFWGLPVYPATAYYRTFQTAVSSTAHLFEFVVPMQPTSWNDRDRVAQYAAALSRSSAPTCVALTLLDVCAPAVAPDAAPWREHWGLTHFLLDGHHKIEAAAEIGKPLRLLSILDTADSLASPEQIDQLTAVLRQPAAGWSP